MGTVHSTLRKSKVYHQCLHWVWRTENWATHNRAYFDGKSNRRSSYYTFHDPLDPPFRGIYGQKVPVDACAMSRVIGPHLLEFWMDVSESGRPRLHRLLGPSRTVARGSVDGTFTQFVEPQYHVRGEWMDKARYEAEIVPKLWRVRRFLLSLKYRRFEAVCRVPPVDGRMNSLHQLQEKWAKVKRDKWADGISHAATNL